MLWIQLFIATAFVLFGAGCIFLTLLSLPGAWLMILGAVLIEIFDGYYLSGDPPTTFSLWIFLAAALLALAGEVLEFAAGAAGAKTGGASKRGMWGAFLGGMVGAIAGTPIFPVVGSVLGAVVGAAIGAIIGEMSVQGATWRGSLKPAGGAAAGRFAGTIAKIGVAAAVWLVLGVAVFWP